MNEFESWIEETVASLRSDDSDGGPHVGSVSEEPRVASNSPSAPTLRTADEWVETLQDAVVRGDVGHGSESLLTYLNSSGSLEAFSTEPPSGAELFDAYLAGHLERIEDAGFEIIARPGDVLQERLPPGAVVLTRALGEGRLAHAAMLRDGRLLDVTTVTSAGLRQDDRRPGYYVEVIDPWARSRYGVQSFARRIADPARRLDADRLVLRPLVPLADAAPEFVPETALASPIIAGPILRRATSREVFVWLATQEPLTGFEAAIYQAGTGNALVRSGQDQLQSVAVGQRLHVHLMRIPAPAGGFPTRQLLSYDLFVGGQPVSELRGPLSFEPGSSRPSFSLDGAGGEQPYRFLHASCRKLHGQGEDALAQNLLSGGRPQALFLTGDQIYGDDLHPDILAWCATLGNYLVGSENIPGIQESELAAGVNRRPLIERLGYTAHLGLLSRDAADHHAIRLGEYIGLYLMAWDDSVWPSDRLQRERAGVAEVRRLLANVPVYMIFDDHEVTDDWNLDSAQNRNMLSWRPSTRSRQPQNPPARRVIANALAAYWLFQGWGNDPQRFGPQQFPRTVDWLRTPSDVAKARIACNELLGPVHPSRLHTRRQDWSFVAPTVPPVVALDTRTQRELRESGGGPGLQSPQQLANLRQLIAEQPGGELTAQEGGERQLLQDAFSRGLPLVLISPSPLLGMEIVELLQRVAAVGSAGAVVDNEAWVNGRGGRYRDMLQTLVQSRAPYCVVLSGDVHYAYSMVSYVSIAGRRKRIVQLTSSPAKNREGLAEDLARVLNAAATGERNVSGAIDVLARRYGEHVASALASVARTLPLQVQVPSALQEAVSGLLRRALMEFVPSEASFFASERRIKGWVESPRSPASSAVLVGQVLAGSHSALAELVATSTTPVVLPDGLARDYGLTGHDWWEHRRLVRTSSGSYLIADTNVGEVSIAPQEVRHTLHCRRDTGANRESAVIRIMAARDAERLEVPMLGEQDTELELDDAPEECRRAMRTIHRLLESGDALADVLAIAPSFTRTPLSLRGFLWQLGSGAERFARYRPQMRQAVNRITQSRVREFILLHLLSHAHSGQLHAHWLRMLGAYGGSESEVEARSASAIF